MKHMGMEVNANWLKSLGNGAKIGFYDGVLGQKYRIIVPYEDNFYAVFWIQFCADGSVYCGIRDKAGKAHEPGAVTQENGRLILNLNDVQGRHLLEKSKDRFSFHGSGEIHDPQIGHNTYRRATKDIDTQEELFRVVFKNISKFEHISQSRKTDICILTNIEPEHALLLTAYISPKGKAKIPSLNDGANNYIVCLSFPKSDEIDEFSIQLCFAPTVEKGTPDISVLMWPVQG